MKRDAQITILAVIGMLGFIALIGLYLYDGAQITLHVNTPTEKVTSEATLETETEEAISELIEPVNINTGRDIDFMSIPGIGEILAERIVKFREENGEFTALEDIMKVEGFGIAKFEKIKEYLVI